MTKLQMKASCHLLFLTLVYLTSGCTSTPEVEEIQKEHPPLSAQERHYIQSPDLNGAYNQINVENLIQELEMDRPLSSLGFQERSFNTCDIKSNTSPNPLCQQLFLVRLNFHILCRDSVGTVSTGQLQPFVSNRLQWRHQGFRGVTTTTEAGFGSLGFISPRSSSAGHLYFYLDRKVARKSLRDNWKLVLPQSWCEDGL